MCIDTSSQQVCNCEPTDFNLLWEINLTTTKVYFTTNCLFSFLFFFAGTDAKIQSKLDQSTASSWWRPAVSVAPPSLYSATHGVVQTHPALSGSVPRPVASSSVLTGPTPRPISGSTPRPNANGKLPLRHLDYSSSATAELRRNPSLSAPDECARACREGEPPKTCYYHFTLEYYTVLGA